MLDTKIFTIGGFLVGLSVFLFVKALVKCIENRTLPLPWEPWGLVIGISIVMMGAGIGILLTAVSG
ncbi:MAG: hypothetical protein QME47_06605 [Candidatus Thermoplasmatota archaeon]|nr:hypothetical protein [Candidatus Thermoplasmatota archaeon]